MAENKTKPTDVSVAEYVGEIGDEAKQKDARKLIALMRRVTGEKPKMWGPSIIGFGKQHYKYESGREGDMPIVGFSPRKAATVIYGATGFEGADTILATLGKHTMGKGCLYVKQLADVDEKTLEKLIERAVRAKSQKP